MNEDELRELNDRIALLHHDDDVENYNIDPSNQIWFPRGFLRTLNENRAFIAFITDENLRTRVANQMMLRDTLHWLWLKTDIIAHARDMLIKQQLINLGSIVEAIVVFLTMDRPGRETRSVYTRLDSLESQNKISRRTCERCKSLWESRRQIHLHLIEDEGEVEYSDFNYVQWHEPVIGLIGELAVTI